MIKVDNYNQLIETIERTMTISLNWSTLKLPKQAHIIYQTIKYLVEVRHLDEIDLLTTRVRQIASRRLTHLGKLLKSRGASLATA